MIKKKTDDHSGRLSFYKTYLLYFNLILQMVVMVLLGVIGGARLDKVLQLKFPVFTLLFTLLTAFLALYLLFRTISKK